MFQQATYPMSEDHDVDTSESPKPDENTAAINAFLQICSVVRSHTPTAQPRIWSQGQRLSKNVEEAESSQGAVNKRWETMCAALRAYRQEHDNCQVPHRYLVNDHKLGFRVGHASWQK